MKSYIGLYLVSLPLPFNATISSCRHIHYLQLLYFKYMTVFLFRRCTYCQLQMQIVTWNSLPRTVTDNDTLATFKSRLKTFLFSLAFN